MLRIESNMDMVVNKVNLSLNAINVDEMTRLQATTLLAQMRKRIHVRGVASDGRPIGTYSQSYLKHVRPKHKRSGDSKVILSLTRAMENGMILFPITNGTAIGYATPELLQRARWQEKRPAYGARAIFSPTQEELELVNEIGNNYIAEQMKQV
jgi:hypothetical protein